MQATGSHKKIVLLATLAMAEVLAFNVSIAAPPTAPVQKTVPHASVAQNQATPATHLDLHLPARIVANDDDKPLAFPSAFIHRQFGGIEQTAQLPSLGAGNPHTRPPMMELARHIQHEGLPIARIWENHSALVHLGLNQRGKPGLWLVQKIH
jgi:hypothetical protein